MPDPLNIPIRASTQEHLEIEDIKDGVVILKNGSACLILSTTAINFNLLSEKEQEATIYAYAGLLNSLTFPIQIVILSKKKDISSYLRLLEEEIGKQRNALLKAQMEKYRQFIEETVKKNNVLDKQFFVILPFSCLELGITPTVTSVFKKSRSLPFAKDYILERAKMSLHPKRDQIIRQFNVLGLKTRVLNTAELIQLFFNIYNPEAAGVQRVILGRDYTTPLVTSL